MKNISCVFTVEEVKNIFSEFYLESDFLASLQLPEYIYTGMDSVCKILDLQYKNVMLVADTETSKNTQVIQLLESKANSRMIRVETVISDSCISVFSQVQEKLIENTPGIIIAVGDGKIIDCVSAISSLTKIPFAAIPHVAPTALWDSDCVDAFLDKKVPSVCVLDPEMILHANSAKIAYEGLGMLTLAAESFLYSSDRYIKTLSHKAFSQIHDNLFDSYTGEISARENLLEGMYWAYISYINSYEYSWESPCYRLCDFFERFDIDSLSLLAVSCVQILEGIYKDNTEEMISLSQGINSVNRDGMSGEYLTDSVRKLRAKMSIPKAVKNLGADKNQFILMCDEISDEDKKMFEQSFYGEKQIYTTSF